MELVRPEPGTVDFRVVFAQAEKQAEEAENLSLEKGRPVDEIFLSQLRRNCAWRYPHEEATHIPQKLGVSAVAKKQASDRYAFYQDTALPGRRTAFRRAEGDALHHFMQYADYDRCAADPAEELERLLRLGF